MHPDAPPVWGDVQREYLSYFADSQGQPLLPELGAARPAIVVRALSRTECPPPGSLEPLTGDSHRLAFLFAWAKAEAQDRVLKQKFRHHPFPGNYEKKRGSEVADHGGVSQVLPGDPRAFCVPSGH